MEEQERSVIPDEFTVYARMANGDEVIAVTYSKDVYGVGDKYVVLNNPMQLEHTFSNDGKRYTFLKRYNPYTIITHVVVPENNVMFISPVLPYVEAYYDQYVKFFEQKGDMVYKVGIEDVMKHISKKFHTEEPTKDDVPYSSSNTSSTRH